MVLRGNDETYGPPHATKRLSVRRGRMPLPFVSFYHARAVLSIEQCRITGCVQKYSSTSAIVGSYSYYPEEYLL